MARFRPSSPFDSDPAQPQQAAGDMSGAPVSPPSSPTITLDDIYFTLFRHKWLILVFSLLGVLAAYGALKLRPPPYISTAKLLVRYVQDKQTITASGEENRVRAMNQGPESIMQTEAEILRSYDLALAVADAFGTARIVGPDAGPEARKVAAAVIQSGLRIETRSSILGVTWEGSDPGLVQPVLDQIVTIYLNRHVQLHSASGVVDEALTQQTDQLRSRLSQTEDELRRAQEKAGVISIEEAKRDLSTQATALEREIYAAQVEVAERRTTLSALSGGVPESEGETIQPPPDDKRVVYRQIVSQLHTLYEREQEMLTQFTPESPMVQRIRTQIIENENLKRRLEQEYPQLTGTALPSPKQSAGDSTPAYDPNLEAAQLKARETRVKVLTEQLTEVRGKIAALNAVESSITELRRRKELEEEQYRYFSRSLEQARIDEALGSGRVSGISVLQAPSPPRQDFKKLFKILAILAAGGVGAGIGLAFAIELFLDQTVRRPSEVESRLNLPLVMSIPKLRQTTAPATGRKRALLPGTRASSPEPDASSQYETNGLVPWTANGELKKFLDALRNRIVYNFEMRNITRKPKLVAVTSCSPDSGVSTVAVGLAASLSETGDGNVLLVDMNPERKTTQYFHRGDLKIGLDDVLAEERRDDALVQENLYMVSQGSSDDRLSWVLPKRFASIVPKLKASDYDYIIFDLPPVSQISATPQIARFMDQVLMVVESGKTSRDAVKRAGAMLTEAGANVGVVLNKSKSYVPAALASGPM